MTPGTAQFIQRMEAYGAQGGLPRSAAKVLGYLTVSEPARQPADEITRTLHLSAGSVSSAVALLRRAGLIDRSTQPGSRRHYYELNPEGWKRATLQQFKMMKDAIDLAEKGLEASPGNRRLMAMRDVFVLFDEEFERIARRLS